MMFISSRRLQQNEDTFYSGIILLCAFQKLLNNNDLMYYFEINEFTYFLKLCEFLLF